MKNNTFNYKNTGYTILYTGSNLIIASEDGLIYHTHSSQGISTIKNRIKLPLEELAPMFTNASEYDIMRVVSEDNSLSEEMKNKLAFQAHTNPNPFDKVWKEYPDFNAKKQFPTYEFYKFHKEAWENVITYLENF